MKKLSFLVLTLFLTAKLCFAQENGVVTYTVTHNWIKKMESCEYIPKADKERSAYVWGSDNEYTPAEKLVIVQKLMAQDDPRAAEVYRNVGIYLGHTVPLYESLYHMDYVLLLGRVMSGKGGELIVSEAQRVLKEEYPECGTRLLLPDEKTRRVGQSVAAASLPEKA